MLRFLPWWVFLLAGLLFGAVAVSMTRDYLADRADLDAALASPPETILLSELPDAPDHPPFSEFAVRDFAGYYVGVVDAGRSGRSFLVIESFSTPPVYIAFTAATFEETMFEREALLLEQDWENRVVRGLLTNSTSYRDDLIAFLSEEDPNFPQGPILMAEFLEGERDAALTDWVAGNRIVVLIAWGLTGVLGLVTVLKFVGWRRRRAAKQQAARDAKLDSGPIDSGGS
ncbi:hypothetical protein [Gymnodinialimonas hymeniacidonis]|uniref:hypothetical protein n=1 Tax=Gymnodinialimonas hymeniacidonis TaxID=3126508 RepID=UPI0034C5FFF2